MADLGDERERERLAKMCDTRASRADFEAADCKREMAESPKLSSQYYFASECLPDYEAEAADWRKIARLLRTTPSQRNEKEDDIEITYSNSRPSKPAALSEQKGADVGEWRPIESAPRDGHHFLAVLLNTTAPPTIGMIYGWPDEEPWRWYPSANHVEREVTHWMPLPPPPQSEEQR